MGKSWKDAFPGNWLKAEDLQNRRVLVTIEKHFIEEVGDDRKLVLRFRGKEKGLVTNKTNAQSIADILGTEDLDRWVGQTVILFPTMTDFQGKRVPCIRVDDPRYGTQARPEPPPPQPELTENEIPF